MGFHGNMSLISLGEWEITNNMIFNETKNLVPYFPLSSEQFHWFYIEMFPLEKQKFAKSHFQRFYFKDSQTKWSSAAVRFLFCEIDEDEKKLSTHPVVKPRHPEQMGKRSERHRKKVGKNHEKKRENEWGTLW
jgi:hypothetical protein